MLQSTAFCIVVFAQLVPQPNEHNELIPSSYVEAAKITNNSNALIEFQFQIGGGAWRQASIAPGSGTYLSIESPLQSLKLRYFCGHRWHDEELKTAPVFVARQDKQLSREQRARNDEAFPYHFRSADNGVHLFRGFHPDFIRATAKALAKELRAADVDLRMISKAYDVSRIEPVVVEAEFVNARTVISRVIMDAIKAEGNLDLRLDWSELQNNTTGRQVPELSIGACRTVVIADFAQAVLREMSDSKLAIASPAFAVECCASVTVRTPQLKPGFLQAGTPDFSAITTAVEGSLRKTLSLGVDHANDLDDRTFHVCSGWKQTSTDLALYRWKLKVIVARPETEKFDRNSGVTLHTNVVAEKKSYGTTNWRKVADFVVARMGELDETNLFIVRTCYPRGLHPRQVPFSTARTIATETQNRLRTLLTVPTTDVEEE